MVICERCFCDTEVISVIRNKAEIGDCPLCKCKNVHMKHLQDRKNRRALTGNQHISLEQD